jgi:methionyl-tRNA formyltransferase
MMKVSILCTDSAHPVNAWLERWAKDVADRAQVQILRDFRELSGGDFLFLVSCHQIIGKPVRDLFRHTLVLHASALPEGRGMSPHVWQIIEGRKRLTLTLLNAEDALDSGDIWHQLEFDVPDTALAHEIHALLFDAELELMSWAIANCDERKPRPQTGEGTFYRRRKPADSEIDPRAPLADYFDLLRIADPDRYPAFFTLRGQKYRIRIDKL